MIGLFADRALALVALAAPVIVVVLLLITRRRRRLRLSRFGDAPLVERLAPAGIARATRWRAVRLGLAAVFAAVALLGPRWGEERTSRSGEGADVVLAVDVSKSMLATDERPTRLDRVRTEIRRLRASGAAHRFALIAFAGRSYVLTPLTADAGAIDLYLEHLDPTVAGQPGSAIAPALQQGVQLLLAAHSSAERALVLFTDGESWEDNSVIQQAARAARDNDVRVIAVGFGTVHGSAIPELIDGRRDYHRDRNGDVVISHARPEVLDAIAQASGGEAIPAEVTGRGIRIQTALASLRTESRVDSGVVQAQARFQWFLLPALLLVLWDTLAGEGWMSPRRARAMRAPVAAALLLVVAPQDTARTVPSRPVATDSPGADAGPRSRSRAARDSAVRRWPSRKAADEVFDWRFKVRAGDHRPATLYNLGTALLAADSIGGAVQVLDPLLRSENAEVRDRAQFNLALAHLTRGRADDPSSLTLAAELYKKYLLLHPRDADAKWNYELALRQPQGGGKGDSNPQQASPSPEQAPAPQPQGGLDRRQAEQLLDNAARDERDVQGRRQKHTAGEPPRVEHDW